MATVGIHASRIAEVMLIPRLTDAAIRVLVKHLDMPHVSTTLSHIVRCLAGSGAKKYHLFERFLDTFVECSESGERPLQEALAIAIAYHATKADVPAVLYAAQLPGSRRFFAHVLPYFRRNRCREIGPRLEEAIARSMVDVGWHEGAPGLRRKVAEMSPPAPSR